jgi:putative heme iron utilization protein
MTGEPAGFGPGVVDAIVRHMNVDNAGDSLLICQALGGRPDATAAAMAGMDADGIDFVVESPGGPGTVRIPWSHRLTAREEVRAEVVRMYRESCAEVGREPRPDG